MLLFVDKVSKISFLRSQIRYLRRAKKINTMKPSLLILAAGMGSRYGGLKQMDAFGPNGETIIEYSIYDAIRSGYGKVVFIIRDSFRENFMNYFVSRIGDRIRMAFVNQDMYDLPGGFQVPTEREKPWGTGHAVWVARNEIKEPFAVINADDFYGRSALAQLSDFLRENQSDPGSYSTVSYYLRNTLSEHGTVNRGVCRVSPDGYLEEVTERTRIKRMDDGRIAFDVDTDHPGFLGEDILVSMNMWGFQSSYFEKVEPLLTGFLSVEGDKPKSEFYIPNAIQHLMDDGQVRVKVLASEENWFGVTYPEDKPFVQEQINRLIEQGKYPTSLWD